MRTFQVELPTGAIATRKSSTRVYTHAVIGVLTDGRVHANFATSEVLAGREARTQEQYGIKTSVVPVQEVKP